jgi:hypothetical protein
MPKMQDYFFRALESFAHLIMPDSIPFCGNIFVFGRGKKR